MADLRSQKTRQNVIAGQNRPHLEWRRDEVDGQGDVVDDLVDGKVVSFSGGKPRRRVALAAQGSHSSSSKDWPYSFLLESNISSDCSLYSQMPSRK